MTMPDKIQHDKWIIHLFTEIIDSEPVYTVDCSYIPSEHAEKITASIVYQELGRAGIKYDYSEFERRFGVKMDYFKALQQAVDKRKKLIDDSFAVEREKNHRNYLDHCEKQGINPHQIFIDFPI